MSGFSIRRSADDGVCYLRLSGELDLATVEELRQALAASAGQRVVVDTTELGFIDSTGLGALVLARDERGPDRFALVPGPATERILSVTGLGDLFGARGDE